MDEENALQLIERAKDALLTHALRGRATGVVEPAKDLLELEGMSELLAYLIANEGYYHGRFSRVKCG